jgi:hypothetical protein
MGSSAPVVYEVQPRIRRAEAMAAAVAGKGRRRSARRQEVEGGHGTGGADTLREGRRGIGGAIRQRNCLWWGEAVVEDKP